MSRLKEEIVTNPRHLGQIADVHNLLSDRRPATGSAQDRFCNKLKTIIWSVLLYVCDDLVVFPPHSSEKLQRLQMIRKRDVTKDDMVDALLNWEESPFVWPSFTSTHCPPAKTSGSTDPITYFAGLPCHALSSTERQAFMQDLATSMKYTTAVHIGHIHQYLWEPVETDDVGKERLAKRLKTKTRDALLYVCADLNRIPRDISTKVAQKSDLISLLVDWVSTLFIGTLLFMII
ncbi:hypothetical protein C8R42DRAFT_598036 [Lentinula raphanica]|nr:hypothetical protein C8R42DRAFT_598036 [Lentinula raphanica]